MAFIDIKDPLVLNVMLTSKGRELLSTGNLTFKYFAVGDSEIDYGFIKEVNIDDAEYSAYDSTILQPTDKNPRIISFIPSLPSGDTYNTISGLTATSYNVTHQVEPIGFFSSGATQFIVDADHVKQPDAMVYVNGVTGGTTLRLRKAPTYGTSGQEPAIGDLVLVKWVHYGHTTGYTVNKNVPSPYLTYQIIGKSGMLANDDLTVIVDRSLPNFKGFNYYNGIAGAMIYYNFSNYTGSTIYNDLETDYISESVLSFTQNNQCPIPAFPFWNMSIVYTSEIAGVMSFHRKYTQFDSRTYGGFVTYIQNQMPVYDKLGIIHYSNESPANTYGDAFNLKTARLEIPTIMWHKSITRTLGVTLVPTGSTKTLAGLETQYYDLADLNGNIVGKVFIDLKMFLIEDQELLSAMSYKSNRSWTLPDYYVDEKIPTTTTTSTSTSTTTTTSTSTTSTTTTSTSTTSTSTTSTSTTSTSTSTTSTSTTSTSTTSTSTTSTSTTSTSTTSTSTTTTTCALTFNAPSSEDGNLIVTNSSSSLYHNIFDYINIIFTPENAMQSSGYDVWYQVFRIRSGIGSIVLQDKITNCENGVQANVSPQIPNTICDDEYFVYLYLIEPV
jgi:hypothetical protein